MRTNFRWEDKYLTMTKGDTVSFAFEIYDQNDEPIDMDRIAFVCKKNLIDNSPVFEKTIDNGITKVDVGKYIIRIAPTDTVNIASGQYYYSFRATVNSDVFTIYKGILDIQNVA